MSQRISTFFLLGLVFIAFGGVDDIHRPNGLTFSPDEKVLYVADTERNSVYAFDVQPKGTLANRRIFANPSGFPDGIKVDVNGNLYVTNNTSVVRIYDDAESPHLQVVRVLC